MKEAIFILLIVAVLIGLTAFRYRKQILAVLNVWRMLKSMKHANTPGIEGSERASGPLVNCAKCGTWVPETHAMKFGKNSYYCSAACVEKSAKMA